MVEQSFNYRSTIVKKCIIHFKLMPRKYKGYIEEIFMRKKDILELKSDLKKITAPLLKCVVATLVVKNILF